MLMLLHQENISGDAEADFMRKVRIGLDDQTGEGSNGMYAVKYWAIHGVGKHGTLREGGALRVPLL